MKKFLPVISVLAVLVFVLHLVADRLTPYTTNARVKAIVVPITPQVSGYVSAVAVANFQPVKQGDTLLKIDPAPYLIDVQSAEAQLAQAMQNLGVSAADVEIAQSQQAKAQVAYDNVRLQSQRIVQLKQQNLVSQSSVDDIQAKLDQAHANLTSAQASLLKAKEKLGGDDQTNPAVKRALANLERARLKLAWTELSAPSRGVVVDQKVGQGTYARANQALMTFISAEQVWVDAFFTENNLGNVALGDDVDVVLDVHPGEVFSGKVVSMNAGAATGSLSLSNAASANGNLPATPRMSGWMRDPQRFAIRIVLDDHAVGKIDDDITFRFNGQADVVVYTQQSNGLMNALAKLWIHLNSYFSYAY